MPVMPGRKGEIKGERGLTQQQLRSKGPDARVGVVQSANQHCQHQQLCTGAMGVAAYHGYGLQQGLLHIQPLLLLLSVLKQLLHLLSVQHQRPAILRYSKELKAETDRLR